MDVGALGAGDNRLIGKPPVVGRAVIQQVAADEVMLDQRIGVHRLQRPSGVQAIADLRHGRGQHKAAFGDDHGIGSGGGLGGRHPVDRRGIDHHPGQPRPPTSGSAAIGGIRLHFDNPGIGNIGQPRNGRIGRGFDDNGIVPAAQFGDSGGGDSNVAGQEHRRRANGDAQRGGQGG